MPLARICLVSQDVGQKLERPRSDTEKEDSRADHQAWEKSATWRVDEAHGTDLSSEMSNWTLAKAGVAGGRKMWRGISGFDTTTSASDQLKRQGKANQQCFV